MKDLARALRRHHAARIKRARRFYFGIDNSTDLRRLGKLLNTPTPCSCWMCGNPRRQGELSVSELLHALTWHEDA
ncbi:hypothetical protein [Massilia sp. Root351]|jgi:hypothetical protein|uniref:hypothetical protein n=1 Tax=Massilia sp. Root351 TaxID=1736522 RepID=UPI0012F6F181|nr:hypothetical protein [Massilia sp. Root351]